MFVDSISQGTGIAHKCLIGMVRRQLLVEQLNTFNVFLCTVKQTNTLNSNRQLVRQRLEEIIQQKVEGQEVTIAPTEEPKAQIIDLMEALKASLGEAAPVSKSARAAESKPETATRKPARKAARKVTRKKKKASGSE